MGEPVIKVRRDLRAGRRGQQVRTALAAVAILVLAAVAGYVWRAGLEPEAIEEPGRDRPAVRERAAAEEAAPEAAAPGVPAEAAPPEALPPVDESDAWVREAAGGLSSHPLAASLLASDGLAARFVASLDRVAEGESPRSQLGVLKPKEPFRAVERNGRTVTDPASFARYDALAALVASLDAGACAALYRRAQPLLAEAYRALGSDQPDLDARLAAAIRHLRVAPTPKGDEELVQEVLRWEYKDPKLEALSPAQKHLLRMGPANSRVVHAKLGELQRALGLAP